jgi:hypothetical protein
MDLMPLPEFHRCVDRYQGDYKMQSFSALDQFLRLAFAQLLSRESARHRGLLAGAAIQALI